MARKFLTAIDLAKNELQNAAVQNLASAPSSPVKGQIYYDSTGNILYWYNGSGWVAAQGGAGAVPATTVTTSAVADASVVGVASTYAREDHKHGREAFGAVTAEVVAFGTSAANGSATTIARSDHAHGNPVHGAAAHTTIPLDTFASPIGSVSMGSQRIIGMADPQNAQDAATKIYVDYAINGLAWKDSVRLATTANHSLAGLSAIDGVTPSANDRILVKNQTGLAANGIYNASSTAWTRAADADVGAEIEGMAVFVTEGTTQADTAWICTANAPISVGATNLPFTQFGAGATYTAGAGMTQTANTFDVVAADSSIVVAADSVTRGALSGEVTAGQGSNITVIAANAVTNAKAAQMAQSTIKGRAALAGTGDPQDLTVSQFMSVVQGSIARISVATITAGATFVHPHNLGSNHVMVTVYRSTTPWDTVECDVERTTINSVTLRFTTAVANGEYWSVVFG